MVDDGRGRSISDSVRDASMDTERDRKVEMSVESSVRYTPGELLGGTDKICRV